MVAEIFSTVDAVQNRWSLLRSSFESEHGARERPNFVGVGVLNLTLAEFSLPKNMFRFCSLSAALKSHEPSPTSQQVVTTARGNHQFPTGIDLPSVWYTICQY